MVSIAIVILIIIILTSYYCNETLVWKNRRAYDRLEKSMGAPNTLASGGAIWHKSWGRILLNNSTEPNAITVSIEYHAGDDGRDNALVVIKNPFGTNPVMYDNVRECLMVCHDHLAGAMLTIIMILGKTYLIRPIDVRGASCIGDLERIFESVLTRVL